MSGQVAAKPKAAERIQEAARELFERQGIRATGVEEVCRVAGATKMSLYRAYPSKDALVAAILRGTPFLDRDTRATRVLVLALEESARDVKRRLLKFDVDRGAGLSLQFRPVPTAPAEWSALVEFVQRDASGSSSSTRSPAAGRHGASTTRTTTPRRRLRSRPCSSFAVRRTSQSSRCTTPAS